MKIIQKSLTELRPPERNVRIHNSKQLREFQRSVEMFGQIRPLVIDESGVILAGNGLYAALLALNYEKADCYVVAGLSEAQKKKLMLADNRIYDLGFDDIDTLDAFIKELGGDLDIPGFDAELLQAMAMEAEAASAALCEYGLIDEAKETEIISTGERYASQNQAAAEQPVIKPDSAADIEPIIRPVTDNAALIDNADRPFVVCPKCGERIWL